MHDMTAPTERTAEKKKRNILMFFTGFIRIRGIVNWSAISFFGFLVGITVLDIESIMVPFFFFAVSTFFILAFTFAINNYYDVDTDKENPRRAHLNIMASGHFSKRAGLLLNLLFIIIPLVLSFFYSPVVFVFCAGLIFWVWAYSAPPLRLKGRPGLDILWHFIVFFALILWGAYLAGSISLLAILVAVSFGLYGCFAQIDNHIHDYPFDKASGSQTFAVRLGLPAAYKALSVTFILYLVFLVPLIILFSLPAYLTIVIVGGGIVGSIIVIKIKKSTKAESLFPIINCLGWAVYLNCLLYHLSYIL